MEQIQNLQSWCMNFGNFFIKHKNKFCWPGGAPAGQDESVPNIKEFGILGSGSGTQRPGGRGLVLLSSSLLNIWMFHNSKFKLIKFHLIKLKSVKPERAETWHSAQNMLIFQIMNLKFRWSWPDIDLELIELNFYTLFRYLLCEN